MLNNLYLIVIRSMGAITMLAFNIYLAREYDESIAGNVMWLTSVVLSISLFSSLGLNDLLLKKSSIFTLQDKRVVSLLYTGLKMVSAFSFLLVLCVILIILLSKRTIQVERFYLIVFSGVFFSLFNLTSFYLLGGGRKIISVFIQNISFYLLFILIDKLVFGASASETALSFFIASFLTLVISSLYVFYYGCSLKTLSFGVVLSSSKGFYLVAIWSMLFNLLPPLIVGGLISPKDFAVLNMSLKITAIFNFVVIIANLILAPMIAKSFHNNDFKFLRAKIKYTLRLLYLIVFIIVVLFMAFYSHVYAFLGGEYLVHGKPLVMILLFGQVVNVITAPAAFLLTMTKNESSLRKVYQVVTPIYLVMIFLCGLHGSLILIASVITFFFVLYKIVLSFKVYKELAIKILPF